jgi:hypothetical protein
VQPDVLSRYVLAIICGVLAVRGRHVHHRRHGPELQPLLTGYVRELHVSVRVLDVCCG